MPLTSNQNGINLCTPKKDAQFRVMHQLVGDLRSSISPHRLERYRLGGGDLDMLTNYYWNVALAEALLCPLNAVEILLRNTIHDSLSRHFGAANWYDRRGILDIGQQKQLAKAKRHIGRRGRTVTPERVVSSLTFGFWVTLLSRPYDTRLWRATHAATLRAAFPHVPRASRQRVKIHAFYNDLLTLRNDAYHHEPLCDRPRLLAEHAAIYEGISWINPAIITPTQLFDRFPDTHANGRSAVESLLKAHLGIP